jgi:hypothetical protein
VTATLPTSVLPTSMITPTVTVTPEQTPANPF